MHRLKKRIIALALSALMVTSLFPKASDYRPVNSDDSQSIETNVDMDRSIEVTDEEITAEQTTEVATEEVTEEVTTGETSEEVLTETTTEESVEETTEATTEEVTIDLSGFEDLDGFEEEEISEVQTFGLFEEEEIPETYAVDASTGQVSPYTITLNGVTYSNVGDILGGTGTYWNVNHKLLEIRTPDGITPNVYCAEPSEATPNSSVDYTEVFETDINTEEGKKTIKYQGIMPYACSGYASSSNNPEFYGWARNGDYGGTFGTYVISGVARQGMMVNGVFYEMNQAEAVAVCAAAVHAVSGSDISSVYSKVDSSHSTAVSNCFNHLVRMGNYAYNQSVNNGSFWYGLDSVNNAVTSALSINYAYWVQDPNAIGTANEWVDINSIPASQSGDFDWSPYVNSSGKVVFNVRLETTGMETKLIKASAQNGTLGNVSYSHSATTGCNFDASKAGYYDYFQITEGANNTVSNIQVNYGGLSSLDYSFTDPTTGGYIVGTKFYQDAHVTIDYSQLKAGKVLDLDAASGTGMYAGLTIGNPLTPVGKVFRAAGYQDVVLTNSNNSTSKSLSVYASELKKGSVSLKKESDDKTTTNNNNKYDLTGAEYSVYKVSSNTDTSIGDGYGTFRITDNTGVGVVIYSRENPSEADSTGQDKTKTVLSELPLGWYMIKETKAPTNGSYELNTTPIYFQITEGNYQSTQSITAKDTPIYKGSVTLKKESDDKTTTNNNSKYNLAGAEYTVYSTTGNNVVSRSNKVGTFKIADNSGVGVVTYSKYNSSEADATGTNLSKTVLSELPLGWYMIEETKAPTNGSYELNSTPIYFEVTKANSQTPVSITAKDSPVYTGSMALNKVSSDPEITDGNSCYDLTGAEYTVYATSGNNVVSRNNKVGTFRIADNYGADKVGTGVVTYSKYNPSEADATGTDLSKTVLSELPLGWYMIEETKAPTNGSYLESDEIKWVQITKNNFSTTQKITVSDTPANDPVVIQVAKVDSEGNVKEGPSLAGAQFTIKYYTGYYDTVESLPATAERTWVLETKYSELYDAYRCGLDDEHKVSGDEFYLDPSGNPIIPLGTITIEETKAPDGYLDNCTLKDADGNTAVNGLYIRKITTSDGNIPSLQGGHEIIVSENPERGGFSFTKINYETRQAMANIPFKLSYLDKDGNVVESHIIVTDSNGSFSTEAMPHSTNTNGNDGATSYDGLTPTGVWFSGSATAVAVNDAVGALPYGTYRLEELPCSANDGLQLIIPYEFTVSDNGVVTSGGIISNVPTPEIGTTEWDKESGTHMSVADNSVTVVDTIAYKYLTAGTKYTAWGILMDKSTGEPFKDANGDCVTSCKVFTVDSSYVSSKQEKCGEIDVEFTFDATDFEGEQFVIYEYLYLGDTSADTFLNADGSITDAECVAKHDDITDINQTGYFAGIETKAWDIGTENNLAFPDEDVVVVDTVTYVGLNEGVEYKLEGKLIDKATGEALLDENGEEITAVKLFTPSEPNGSVDVTFPSFNASLLAGETIVVFENLYFNGNLYASHVDINDEDQSIHFPKVGTTAKDSVTGENISPANKRATIVDTVEYENLIVGKTYAVSGVLMDKETGEPLLDAEGNKITASTTFTAEKSSGTVEVVFTFDARLLQGKTVVVFEDVYYEGKKVATHSDINDEEQTIDFPEIKTSLSDKETDLHMTYIDEDVTLIDTVSYENLVAGEEYVIVGTLMNKDTNKPLQNDGKDITASTTFTPEESSGTVEVEFKFNGIESKLIKDDGSYSDIVAFETLYYNDVEFAVHADIDDVDQTVSVPYGHTEASDSETGTHTSYPDEEVTIIDTVYYNNLVVGKEYVVEGILMTTDENGKAVPFLDNGKEVTGKTTFVAKTSEGSVEIEFKFNASSLQGKTIVVFESMYYEEILVFTHADIDDEDQSINFPKVGTTATNKDGGIKEVPIDSDVTVVDVIAYENLTVGETYVAEGIIYDRSTGAPAVTKDGKNITSRVEFTPTTKDGTVSVEFTFNTTGFDGKTLVVFEKIYTQTSNIVIGVHEDINSDSQAVTVKLAPKTGDISPIVPICAFMIISVTGFVVLRKKKQSI